MKEIHLGWMGRRLISGFLRRICLLCQEEPDATLTLVFLMFVPMQEIASELSQRGCPCSVSNDAGCFVCNYLYFKCLQEAQKSGVAALFVHVPPFSEISLNRQLTAALHLLDLIAAKCSNVSS